MADFQAGDTVQLKSGGPWMTIAHLAAGVGADKSQGAWCDWIDKVKGKQQRLHEWFPLTSLNKVDPAAPPGVYVR
jgi:uncharacterized protein YodC (DUF2158 family)